MVQECVPREGGIALMKINKLYILSHFFSIAVKRHHNQENLCIGAHRSRELEFLTIMLGHATAGGQA